MEDDLFEKLSFICQRKENSALKKQQANTMMITCTSEKLCMGWIKSPQFFIFMNSSWQIAFILVELHEYYIENTFLKKCKICCFVRNWVKTYEDILRHIKAMRISCSIASKISSLCLTPWTFYKFLLSYLYCSNKYSRGLDNDLVE